MKASSFVCWFLGLILVLGISQAWMPADPPNMQTVCWKDEYPLEKRQEFADALSVLRWEQDNYVFFKRARGYLPGRESESVIVLWTNPLLGKWGK